MDAPRLTGFERVRQFTLGLDHGRIPPVVRHFASLLLLDTLGVAAAAKDLEAGRIARDLAARSFGAGQGAVCMLFDGRFVSRAGAACAAASQIDDLEAHDGYNPTKRHIGVVLVPA